MNNKIKLKKITFLLPGQPEHPIGGYKIAYQYADLFADSGYQVQIIYPYVNYDFFKKKDISIFLKLKFFMGFYYRRFRKQISIKNWYKFRNEISDKFVFLISPFFCKKLKESDIIFATSVETAYALNSFKKLPDSKKFYLIQDFENWRSNTDDYCYNSYNFPFTKIVISKWLQERVEQTGNTATVIPNALDFEYFTLSNPIENRKPTEVAMLYHLDDRKRCCDAMAALEIVKKDIPELHVAIFGTPEKPENLPEWYTYYQTPDKETHNSIYNNAAIFVAASMKEGWALPPAEALQCGAALACTDIGGFKDYAIPDETALVSPVYNVRALADNIIKLITNNELRIKIAKNGNNYIQQFTWEKSFSLMQEVIGKNASN